MPICEVCGKEHDGSFDSGRFCSLHCTNSHPHNEITKQKLKNIWNTKRIIRKEQLKKEFRICESCGKLFTLADISKIASGRFCSRSCANTRHHSETTKQKIKKSIQQYCRNKSKDNALNNDIVTRFCVICGKSFLTLYKSKTKTCSKPCSCKLANNTKRTNGVGFKGGGYHENSVKGKSGWYKGIHCQSTYELAWVIYNLDHNIKFKRCEKVFEYEYKGKTHKYYPDFELEDGTIIEIKGYCTDVVNIKKSSVENYGYNYKILYGNNLQYCFDYIENKYNLTKLNIYKLYEQHKIGYTKICPICKVEFNTLSKSVICCSKKCGCKYSHIKRKSTLK